MAVIEQIITTPKDAVVSGQPKHQEKSAVAGGQPKHQEKSAVAGGQSKQEQNNKRLPLEYTPELAKEMAPMYEKVKSVIPPVEWPYMAPYIKAINDLKKQRNAVILAHNYMTPEIFHCISDFMGDSLQLAVEASKVDADVILQCGVHFMAETS